MECPDMPSPLCLVEKTDDGFTLNTEALEMISRIVLPLVVVAIVGPYRTGKSFLLNRLMGKNKGFPLGSSVQAKTKGIWVWCRPHPRNPNLCLLLLDTEGFGDVKKGSPTSDSHMFALATLLSSTLIYNSMTCLENGAIEKLGYVSDLIKLICGRPQADEEDGEEFVKFFPDFVWTIRDFTLGLEIDGRSVTADEYLAYALALKKGSGKEVSDHNKTRECLRSYFKNLKCFVFDRPVYDINKFKILDVVPTSELNPVFVEQAEEFCEDIHSSSIVKNYKGKGLNGSCFCSLLKMYVEAFNSGEVPCLMNANDQMARTENQKTVTKALEIYEETKQRSLSMPTETFQELSAAHQKCEQSAMEYFRKRVFEDKENEYRDVLKMEIEKKYHQLKTENENASTEACRKELLFLNAEQQEKLRSGKYAKSGGFEEFSADVASVEIRFKTRPGLGLMAKIELWNYLKNQEVEGRKIRLVDEKFTQKEKVAAEKEQRALAAEAELETNLKNQRDKKKTEESITGRWVEAGGMWSKAVDFTSRGALASGFLLMNGARAFCTVTEAVNTAVNVVNGLSDSLTRSDRRLLFDNPDLLIEAYNRIRHTSPQLQLREMERSMGLGGNRAFDNFSPKPIWSLK